MVRENRRNDDVNFKQLMESICNTVSQNGWNSNLSKKESKIPTPLTLIVSPFDLSLTSHCGPTDGRIETPSLVPEKNPCSLSWLRLRSGTTTVGDPLETKGRLGERQRQWGDLRWQGVSEKDTVYWYCWRVHNFRFPSFVQTILPFTKRTLKLLKKGCSFGQTSEVFVSGSDLSRQLTKCCSTLIISH